MRSKNNTTQQHSAFKKVANRLEKNGIIYKVIEHEPLVTMGDVFETLKVNSKQAGKTLLLSVEGFGMVAVVLPGTSKIDLTKVSKFLAVPRSKIRFLVKKEVEDLGISIGSASPFLDFITKVIIDESFLSQDQLYCGSGDLCKTIVISIRDLVQTTSAGIADVVKP